MSQPTPILDMTDMELHEAIFLARRLAWVSSIHREYLAELEHEAARRKISV